MTSHWLGVNDVIVLNFVLSPFLVQKVQVVLHRIEATELGLADHLSSRSLALTIATNGAVADLATGRALPVGILQSDLGVFAVAI